MSDARGMEELLAEVLEAVVVQYRGEDRKNGQLEFIVDIQHLSNKLFCHNFFILGKMFFFHCF